MSKAAAGIVIKLRGLFFSVLVWGCVTLLMVDDTFRPEEVDVLGVLYAKTRMTFLLFILQVKLKC